MVTILKGRNLKPQTNCCCSLELPQIISNILFNFATHAFYTFWFMRTNVSFNKKISEKKSNQKMLWIFIEEVWTLWSIVVKTFFTGDFFWERNKNDTTTPHFKIWKILSFFNRIHEKKIFHSFSDQKTVSNYIRDKKSLFLWILLEKLGIWDVIFVHLSEKFTCRNMLCCKIAI